MREGTHTFKTPKDINNIPIRKRSYRFKACLKYKEADRPSHSNLSRQLARRVYWRMNPETAHAHIYIRHPKTATRMYEIRCMLYIVRRQQQFINLETAASGSDIAQLIVN